MMTDYEEERLREQADGLNINATPWTGLQQSWGRQASRDREQRDFAPYAQRRSPPPSPPQQVMASPVSSPPMLAARGGDGRPMCKYFAMGGCSRSDCPFSHDLTVEATSGADALNGFVLSGNVANVRNARSGTRESPLREDNHSWHSQWHTSNHFGDEGGFFPAGSTGNNSQMMSMLLGTAPSGSTSNSANFDLLSNRQKEFTPYPGPRSHTPPQQSSHHQHHSYSSHHHSHGHHHPMSAPQPSRDMSTEEFLPSSDLSQRYLSNNASAAALFGGPSNSAAGASTASSHGSERSFTAYPQRQPADDERSASSAQSKAKSTFDQQYPSLGGTETTPNTASHPQAAREEISSSLNREALSSADLFPPLPSTPSGPVPADRDQPPMGPGNGGHLTYAMKAMTARSTTPSSEGGTQQQHQQQQGQAADRAAMDLARVPRFPVSIDDEMSAYQMLALRRQSDQPSRDDASSTGNGSTHQHPQQSRPQRNSTPPSQPPPQQSRVESHANHYRGSDHGNARGRGRGGGRGADRGGSAAKSNQQRRPTEPPSNAPVPL